ncbi:hypothetical protein ACJX0J_007377, partial [Zea mays]
ILQNMSGFQIFYRRMQMNFLIATLVVLVVALVVIMHQLVVAWQWYSEQFCINDTHYLDSCFFHSGFFIQVVLIFASQPSI